MKDAGWMSNDDKEGVDGKLLRQVKNIYPTFIIFLLYVSSSKYQCDYDYRGHTALNYFKSMTCRRTLIAISH